VFVALCGSQLGGKRFTDDEEVETKLLKWPRQSKDFYAAGFDAFVRDRWDKCINAGGGYVRK
jgi:hypothetical protein